MSGKFFLDTNGLVYAFDNDARKKQTRANELIRRAIESRIGVISWQVVLQFRLETPQHLV